MNSYRRRKCEKMDAGILLWIQENVRNDVLTPFMRTVTLLGNAGWFWVFLSILLIWKKKYRYVGMTSGLALFGSLILNNLFLKNVVGRVRPYEVIDGLVLIGHKAWDASFPSGHSACSFAAATVFFLLLPKRFGIPAVILAAIIAFSRLYIGIHYPTDVLVGTLDGILLGVGAVLFMKHRKKTASDEGVEQGGNEEF